MTFFSIFSIVLIVISAFYFISILLINTGIFRLKRLTGADNQTGIKVSIIIPARNEEENILNCLNDIKNQDYSLDLIEIVVVDDHSTDQTSGKVLDFASSNPFMNLRLIPVCVSGSDRAFKKHAIKSGIEATSGELVITSDADTRSTPGWIFSVVNFYVQEHPEMILGPVAFHDAGSFFEKLQVIEFSGLMAATAGSCKIGFPLMCNGANLAFKRQAWLETNNSSDNLKYPSGDDLFLMMKIRKKYGPGSIKYLFSKESIISTAAKKSFNEFIYQRLRWVSKNRGYTDPLVLAVSMFTWLFNALLLLTLCAGIFKTPLLILSSCLFGVKIILELPAVCKIMSLIGGWKLLYLYPFVQILNLFYVSLIGILGNLMPYEWKGRIIHPVAWNV
ncbi:MAG: glycosyltransferase [Bacteroidales bacterium]|jgi:cellulose synthase/poly-beta-1,6-N-acetylglucosamine synthase-like glycosyltransferase